MASSKIISSILILKYLVVSQSFGDIMPFRKRYGFKGACEAAAHSFSTYWDSNEREVIDKYDDLTGVFAAVFTPVDARGHLAVNVIPEYAQYLADEYGNGVLISGTAGEGPTLSVVEVKTLISAWLDAATPLKIKVIVQIGGRPLPDIEDLARYSEWMGVDAILALPEIYYKPYTVEGLVYNMECIARAAPATPLFYYDIPALTNVQVDMVEFIIQATKRIPTFKGLKEERFETALRVQPILKKDQIIYFANSLFLAPAVFMGLENSIMAETNLFPGLIHEIISNVKKCNVNETRRLNEELIELRDTINGLQSPKGPVPAIKAAMPLVTGIHVGPARAPGLALTTEQEFELKDKLRWRGVKIVGS